MGSLGDLGSGVGSNLFDLGSYLGEFCDKFGRDCEINFFNYNDISRELNNLNNSQLDQFLQAYSFRLKLGGLERFVYWDRTISRFSVVGEISIKDTIDFMIFANKLIRLPLFVENTDFGLGLFRLFNDEQIRFFIADRKLNKIKKELSKTEHMVLDIHFSIKEIPGFFKLYTNGQFPYYSLKGSPGDVHYWERNEHAPAKFVFRGRGYINQATGKTLGGFVAISKRLNENSPWTDLVPFFLLDDLAISRTTGDNTIQESKDRMKAIFKDYLKTIPRFKELKVNMSKADNMDNRVLEILNTFLAGFLYRNGSGAMLYYRHHLYSNDYLRIQFFDKHPGRDPQDEWGNSFSPRAGNIAEKSWSILTQDVKKEYVEMLDWKTHCAVEYSEKIRSLKASTMRFVPDEAELRRTFKEQKALEDRRVSLMPPLDDHLPYLEDKDYLFHHDYLGSSASKELELRQKTINRTALKTQHQYLAMLFDLSYRAYLNKTFPQLVSLPDNFLNYSGDVVDISPEFANIKANPLRYYKDTIGTDLVNNRNLWRICYNAAWDFVNQWLAVKGMFPELDFFYESLGRLYDELLPHFTFEKLLEVVLSDEAHLKK